MATTRARLSLLPLAVATLLFLLMSVACAQDVNLALRRPFTADCGVLPGWDGLTDGQRSSDDPPACFATDNSPKFPKHVVLDLGGKCEIRKVVVHNSANGNTKRVEVSLSTDAKNYISLREYVFPSGKYQPLVHHCTPKQARFLRITFHDSWGNGLGGPNIMYLREAEVYGKLLERSESAEDADWAILAATKPDIPIPSWAAARRYIAEMGRAARILVVADQPAELLVGPSGWVARSLHETKGQLGSVGVHVRFVQYTSKPGEDFGKDFADLMSDAIPDLLLVSVSSGASQEYLSALPKVLQPAADAACSLLICIPPPPDLTDSTRSEQYRTIKRLLLAYASQYRAGVLDIGAVLARAGSATKFLADKGWATDAVKAVAEAMARLLER
jgi:hypothetical protein